MVLPSLSLRCACYTEAVEKLPFHPVLKGFNISFDTSGSYSVDCGNGEHSFLGEEDDPIQLTLEAEQYKGWIGRYLRKIINFNLFFALSDGRLSKTSRLSLLTACP